MKKIFTFFLLVALFAIPRSAQATINWEVSDGTQYRINPARPYDPNDTILIPAGKKFVRILCAKDPQNRGTIIVTFQHESTDYYNNNYDRFKYLQYSIIQGNEQNLSLYYFGYDPNDYYSQNFGYSYDCSGLGLGKRIRDNMSFPNPALRIRLAERILGYNWLQMSYGNNTLSSQLNFPLNQNDLTSEHIKRAKYAYRIILTEEEADTIKSLNFDPQKYGMRDGLSGVQDLSGLEVFRNLEELILANNPRLGMCQNGKPQDVYYNPPYYAHFTLNFTIFPKLKILDISDTYHAYTFEGQLGENNLPKSIEYLYMRNSCLFNEINVDNFPNIKKIEVAENNYFGSEDTNVDAPHQLVSICASNCPQLDTIVVKDCDLQVLKCNSSNIDHLDLTNCSINKVFCKSNKIENLDLSTASIRRLECQNNNMSTLNASNILYLDCSNNAITNLILTNAGSLSTLYCHNNDLTSLDLSACSNLEILNVRNNSLSTLNLANSPLLSELYCQDNGMSTLTLSSDNKALTRLECQRNNIQSLSISNNSVACAPYIDCSNNSPMTNLTLGNASTLYCYNNNNLAALDLTTCTNLKKLRMSHTKVPQINISNCKQLEEIYARNRIGEKGFSGWNYGLTSLDCSGLTKLKTVLIRRNKMTKLDMSGCSALTTLVCNSQGDTLRLLDTLNLTGCTNLTTLECQNNGLTSLDISTCTKLQPSGVKAYMQRNVKDVVVLDRDKVCIELVNGVTPTIADGNIISDADMTNFFGTWSASGFDKNRNKVVKRGGKTYLVIHDIGDNARGGTQKRADVDFYGKQLKYQNALWTNNWNETVGGSLANGKKTDNITVTTYPYVMYINPLTLDVYTDPDNSANHFYSGTIYLDYDAVVPPGTEAYIAQGLQLDREGMITGGENTTSGQLNLVKIEKAAGATNVVIPAYTPVYVKSPSETGLFDFARNLNNEPLATIPSGNIFKGTLRDTTVTPYDILTLSRGYKTGGTGPNAQSRVGFWRFNNTLLPAHRVYIEATEMDKVNASGVRGLTFAFFDSEADLPTSIDRMERVTNTIEQQQRGWYTVSGIRLKGKPTTKGLYIHNGKKVFVE